MCAEGYISIKIKKTINIKEGKKRKEKSWLVQEILQD